jgi:hypothetical protein
MNRLDFIKSLGALVGAAFIPETEPISVERMRITSSGNVCMGTNTPNAELKLEVTHRVNGGMSSLQYRIK